MPLASVTPGLTPAVAARTALACTHVVTLMRSGGRPAHDHVSLDDEGEPLLVVPVAPRPVGAARAVVVPGRPELGRVLLEGSLSPLTGRDHAWALALYRGHLRCFGAREPVAVELARLTVARVSWAVEGHGWRPVPLVDYAVARPCPWAMYGEQYVTHLNHEHAPLVDGLAVRLSGSPDALGSIDTMDAHGVGVTAVDPDGARRHHVRFASPLADPQRAIATIRGWVEHGLPAVAGSES